MHDAPELKRAQPRKLELLLWSHLYRPCRGEAQLRSMASDLEDHDIARREEPALRGMRCAGRCPRGAGT